VVLAGVHLRRGARDAAAVLELRALSAGDDVKAAQLLVFADLAMDQSAHAVTRGRREIQLTLTEYRVLQMFLEHPGQVLSKRQLFAGAWDLGREVDTQAVVAYVCRLRGKLEAGGEPRLIHTERGLGFVLRSGGGA
jgi:two-component system response regulator MprA